MKDKATIQEKVQFLLAMGSALHRYGASADRIEKALFLASEKLNVEANYFSLPTGIFANFKLPNEDEFTSMERLEPGKINLEKLYLADRAVDFVIDDKITVSEGVKVLKDIVAKKPLFSDLLVNISLFFLAFSVAIFLKGNLNDALCSGAFGLLCGLFTSQVKVERIDTISDAALAFIVSFGAFAIYELGVDVTPSLIILSSLIYFIPGLSLTMAIHEISSQNLTSGTARLTGAMVIMLKISFGSYLGAEVSRALLSHYDPYAVASSPALSEFWIVPSIIIAALTFVISFQARVKDTLWILLACLISFSASKFFSYYLGPIPGAVGCGIVIGAGSNLFARALKRPAMIVLMPAIILLVPGSIGYKGLNFLFTQNALEGINTLFNSLSIGVGLVAGAYFGNIIVKPKRTL